MPRVVLLGEVLVDIVLRVPAVPDVGGDVVATSSEVLVGAGFNVLVAVVRQGVPAAYAGGHGTGPWGDMARAAMQDAGIEILRAPTADRDTGFDIALIDAAGERTFVTTLGAEARTTREHLAAIDLQPADLVYVSGYALAFPGNAAPMARWVDELSPEVTVLVDPGPLVAQIPRDSLEVVQRRADWWSCNQREAAIVTGQEDPLVAAAALLAVSGRDGVIVRAGAAGCIVAQPGTAPSELHPPKVQAVDTNGAGDTHAGVFLAAIAQHLDPLAAAQRANLAAAISVTSPGPATAPTAAQIDTYLGTTGSARLGAGG